MNMLITFIIFIVFTSHLFSDTIKYRKKDILRTYIDKVVTDVEYLGISQEGVHYQYPVKYFGNVSKVIDCYDVYDILDDNKNSISYSCSEYTYDPFNSEKVTSNQKIDKEQLQYRGRVGGLFIALGAGMLIIENNNHKCNECSIQELDNWMEDNKKTQNIAYGFIMIGGLLVTIGL